MNEGMIYSFMLGLLVGVVGILWYAMVSKKNNATLRRSLDERKLRLEHAFTTMGELKNELIETRKENKLQNTEIAQLKTSQDILEKMLRQQEGEKEKEQTRMKLEFANLSQSILEKSSKQISDQNIQGLDQILKPFKEKIKEFEHKVEYKHSQDVKDRAQLIEKISHLSELNLKMQEDAKNLTSALKGDSQKQGHWGEMILENVLAYSGLTKGIEYVTQPHVESEEGKRYRPDVIVNLPDNKHLVIDSKVSLTAYERVVSASDPGERANWAKKHMISMRSHIKELSLKNYQNARSLDSPDFVLMFLPIEASFSLAIKEDVNIYDFAWTRKVVIVSPSTLLATLKTIASLWKQEKQNKNAIEIAKQAGALYDKFVGFTEDMLKLGQQINTTHKTYQASMNKLTAGTGNLVKRAQKVKELGAKATKSIPQTLLDDSEQKKAIHTKTDLI